MKNYYIMKKTILISLALLAINLYTEAQENLIFQKLSAEILALADYVRAPSVTMDSKKEFMLLSYRDTYKSLNDLNNFRPEFSGYLF
jgi:hypothetical protein